MPSLGCTFEDLTDSPDVRRFPVTAYSATTEFRESDHRCRECDLRRDREYWARKRELVTRMRRLGLREAGHLTLIDL